MLIVCPNCQTHYSVGVRNLSSEGRAVRCHNCGNVWRQGPVADAPRARMRPAGLGAFPPPWLGQAAPAPYPPAAAPPPPPPSGYPPYPPQGYPPQGYAPQGYAPQGHPPQGYPPQEYAQQGYAPQEYPQQPHAAPAPYPPAAAPPPPPPLPPEPEYEAPAEDLGGFDPDNLVAELRQENEDDGLSGASDAPAEALSEEDLDDIFSEEEDIEPIASVVDADGEATEVEDPDEIPDPEDDDFPLSLTAGLNAENEAEPEKKGGVLKWILLVLILLIAAAGGAGVFLKDRIIGMFPETAALYEAAGLGDKIEESFEFGAITPERVTEEGTDFLIIRGSVINKSGRPMTAPRVRVDLLGEDETSLQFEIVSAEPSELTPGASAEFEARIKEPSPMARRMEATFVPAEEPPAQ